MPGRRLITIPAFIGATLLLTALLPALLMIAFLLRFIPTTRGALATLLFALSLCAVFGGLFAWVLSVPFWPLKVYLRPATRLTLYQSLSILPPAPSETAVDRSALIGSASIVPFTVVPNPSVAAVEGSSRTVSATYHLRLFGHCSALRAANVTRVQPVRVFVYRINVTVLFEQPFGFVACHEMADGIGDLVNDLEDRPMLSATSGVELAW
jgi:hypothetical protein